MFVGLAGGAVVSALSMMRQPFYFDETGDSPLLDTQITQRQGSGKLNIARRHRLYSAPTALVLALIAAPGAWASDLLELNLEDLLDVEVTSVSKSAKTVADSAAAVFVITQDDLRRSGATSIGEALRMVPGIEVAQLDSNKWAITSRGFNRRFANKLLIMMDGRTLYTPLFSGVFWEVQDTVLEDIERIEVIRGPGATIWGANAVNGVINIITKKSQNTQGALTTASVGSHEKYNINMRYGGALSENVSARMYVKALDRGTYDQTDGEEGHDDWRMQQLGFRGDGHFDRHSITFQGDAYTGQLGETIAVATTTPPYSNSFDQDSDVSGQNLLTRYEYKHPTHGVMTAQFYFDHTNRINPRLIGKDDRRIYDLDLYHSFNVDGHNWIWGVGRRTIKDEIQGTSSLSVTPTSLDEHLHSFSVQDTYTLSPAFDLTAGAKIESYTYLDTALQPSLRGLWRATPNQSIWGAISYAERLPSRAERHISLDAQTVPPTSATNPSPWPILVQLQGDPEVVSENMISYELGYRLRRSDFLTLDLALFFNQYDDLRTFELGTRSCAATGNPPPCAPGDYIIQPQMIDAKGKGETYGFEVEADFQILSTWRLRTAYTYFSLDFEKDPDSTDNANLDFEGKSPENQLSVRSIHDIFVNWELDFWLRYVDELPAIEVSDYWDFDIRLAWLPTDSLELSFTAQNLLEDGRSEFTSDVINTTNTQVPRAYYGKLVWRF